MALKGGNISKTDGIYFSMDVNQFPRGWSLTQYLPNPEFLEGGSRFNDHGCYTSGYYLGPKTASEMTGGTLRFTGGDFSNYYGSNPSWRGWDAGGIGGTGGNWMNLYVLPSTADASHKFLYDITLRFVYASGTGNGSTNPTFQMGRGYYALYQGDYNTIGTSYRRIKFLYYGNAAGDQGGSNPAVTFGCTSCDAMVEIKSFYAYKVEGLLNMYNNSVINTDNVSFNTASEIIYDGTNDYIYQDGVTGHQSYQGSIEAWCYPTQIDGDRYVIAIGQTGTYGASRAIRILNNTWSVVNYGSGTEDYNNIAPVAANQWTHVVYVWDNTSIKFYVNGQQYSSTAQTGLVLPQGDRLTIGGPAWNMGGSPFGGKIDEVRAYNRMLSPQEVTNNYLSKRRQYGL